MATPWLLFLFLLPLLTSLSPSSSKPTKITYSDHCHSIVPESTPTALLTRSHSSYYSFDISQGYFSGGGGSLFFHDSTLSSPGSFHFSVRYLHQTRDADTFQLAGTLVLTGGRASSLGRNSSAVLRHALRSASSTRGGRLQRAIFALSGFWSQSSSKLCMVGHGFLRSTFLDLTVVMKLHYPKTSNISTSVVRGTVEILDDVGSARHFDSIPLLAYAQKEYEYTMISVADESCAPLKLDQESLGLEPTSLCSHLEYYFGYGSYFLINPTPFSGFISMSLMSIHCSDKGRVRLFISLSKNRTYVYDKPFLPQESMVAEGFWDHKRNHLCLVACHVHGGSGSSLGDCSVGLSFWFRAFFSIKSRHAIVGRMWSNKKDTKDHNYFKMVSLIDIRDSTLYPLPGVTYRYTELDFVRKHCDVAMGGAAATSVGKKRYPDGPSMDMRFEISVTDSNYTSGWGHLSQFSLNETYNGNQISIPKAAPQIQAPPLDTDHSIWNVGYALSYTLWQISNTTRSVEISAEGVYDARTGKVCLVGCKTLSTNSIDCEILIKFSIPPLNPDKDENLYGTVTSTRQKSDPLYFDPLSISSNVMYVSMAETIAERMGVEIVMVPVSLTLLCLFTWLQLRHVKKHPHVLPSISIAMLVILTLGHMIPLVLNLEALFFVTGDQRSNILLSNRGWLESNETIVRLVTMIAFLLQFRLLQLAWSSWSSSSRSNPDIKDATMWVAQKRALKSSLPLYIAGGLIAWFAQLKLYHHSIWEDLISYAGLVLDSFLLPQIICNLFGSSKDVVLTPVFYFGTTILRAMPHVYDAYRAGHFMGDHWDSSYVYASPVYDLYSGAWDIVVSCGGVIFVVVIYLQQRFGGRCMLPMRWRSLEGEYELAPLGR
ncbi:uncharacterized protein [Typha latifolia]|uniref:uncharacterized protein n=1 Tax=Typha latifolia TaxID=4733 RepID=UPI003C305C00